MESVLETKNYEMFRFGPWNRDISEKNLHKIDKDVQKNGWKKHPITVNEKMEVIDGQHRLVYAKTHNLPVYYIVINDLTVEDCVTMNNVRTAWSLQDYIKLYASQGNECYQRLQKLLGEYSFATASQLISLLKNQCANSNLSGKIRKGEFKLTDKEIRDIKDKFDFLQELEPYVKSVKGRTSSLYQAIAFCYDNEGVNNQRLKKQIKTKLNLIDAPVNTEIAFREIERIYNRGIRTGDYIEIFAQYKRHAREQLQKGVKMINERKRRTLGE